MESFCVSHPSHMLLHADQVAQGGSFLNVFRPFKMGPHHFLVMDIQVLCTFQHPCRCEKLGRRPREGLSPGTGREEKDGKEYWVVHA